MDRVVLGEPFADSGADDLEDLKCCGRDRGQWDGLSPEQEEGKGGGVVPPEVEGLALSPVPPPLLPQTDLIFLLSSCATLELPLPALSAKTVF